MAWRDVWAASMVRLGKSTPDHSKYKRLLTGILIGVAVAAVALGVSFLIWPDL